MFEDPKFWLLVSFIIFVTLIYKPFKSMMVKGLDNKIEEIKNSINSSMKSFNDAEEKLNEAQSINNVPYSNGKYPGRIITIIPKNPSIRAAVR